MLDVTNENNILTGKIVDAGLRVHKQLGTGLLESAYEFFLGHELKRQNIKFKSQCTFPVEYDGETHDIGFRLDLLVEDKVIIEIKSTEKFALVHEAQLLTYMRLSKKPIGLLMNFGFPTFKEGLKRYVL